MVSTSVQPRRSSCCEHRDGDAERRQDHHVVGAERDRCSSGVVGQEADPHRPQLLVDVRVVDDFAGQEHAAVGKALAGLVRVVDGAIDAVAEAEFARQMDGEPAGAIDEVVGLDALDDRAVIVVGQHAGDGMLQVEAFAEDERRHTGWDSD